MTSGSDATDAIEAGARRWQETGWALVEGALPRDLVEEALVELGRCDRREVLGPTRRPEQAVRERRLGSVGGGDGSVDRPSPEVETTEPGFRPAQFQGTTLFPLADCPTLNRLFVHPELVRFARSALGTGDVRIYQSRVWSKHGGHTNYEQLMHRDGNHALIPIVNEPGWWHLECFVYLCDVHEGNGAPRVVPGEVSRAGPTAHEPLDRSTAPELYEAEFAASGSAGSILAYRSDIWHRGAPLQAGAERHVMVVGFRPATAPWVGFDAHQPLVGHPDFARFVGECGPDELSLFGIPEPGHEYWHSPGVLDGMAEMYPGLDLTPWRAAVAP